MPSLEQFLTADCAVATNPEATSPRFFEAARHARLRAEYDPAPRAG